MKVLSLFDGISCGRVALERAGIPVSRYVAFEIEKNAINCSEWNWPEIEHRGSVVGADFSEFAGFDIVMGGFPCTDLSTAKRDRKGLKGEHSKLFWELARAIKEIKPRYFLVENNYRMPKADEAIITETLGVVPIYINSALVSAQTRKRLYWTNIPGVEQPEDRGLYLRDVLDDGGEAYQDKSHALTATYEGAILKNTLERKQRTMVFQRPRGKNLGGLKLDKAPTMTSSSWECNNFLITGAALRTRNTENGRRKKLEVNHTGKANALTTVEGDSVVCAPLCVNLGDKQPSQHARIYSIEAKSPCVTEAHRPNIAVPAHLDRTVKDSQKIYTVRNGQVYVDGTNGGGFTKSIYPTASTSYESSRQRSASGCKPCPTVIPKWYQRPTDTKRWGTAGRSMRSPIY